jgi:cytoskeleton protein RodZ
MGAWRVLVEDENMENAEFAFHTVGEKLKAERERRTLSLDEIAIRTRIPMRHLEAIEKSEYEKLPGSTYAIGFTRSYARALEMDDAKIGADLRIELAQNGIGGFQATTPNYEPADLSSVPSRTLAWTAAIVGALVIGGFLIWRSYFMNGELPSIATETEQSSVPAPSAPIKAPASVGAVNPRGEVTLIAKDVVWIKVYDSARKRLFEAEMKAGDKFTVPKDANGPMIVTGRPHMLTVMIDGKQVAPLSDRELTIADVDISAAALAARSIPAATQSGPSQGAATGPAPAANVEP